MSVQEASHAPAFKPKKSVALSGTAAGETAICTVGHTGNDLHYRGYDIADLAEHCEFAEVAHLLIHGKLPNASELAAYKTRLLGSAQLARGSEAGARARARTAHPMDVLRTGVSVLGCVRPEAEDHNVAGARDIADALLASLPRCFFTGTTLRETASASRSTPTASRWRHIFCICCTAETPSEEWVHAMQVSLILYAEHEFNASTFTARVIAGTGSDIYSCIVGAIGALKGPKHGGANEVALEIQQRYATADEPRQTSAAASLNAKSLSASAIRSIPSAIRAATLSRSRRENWPSTRTASDYSPLPNGLRTPCRTPSACFPTSIGTRQSPTI